MPPPPRDPALPPLRNLAELEAVEEPRTAEMERQDLETWVAFVEGIPTLARYSAQFESLQSYFDEIDIDDEVLRHWRAYRELIMQRFTGVYDDILQVTDIILQDLFHYFVQHKRLAGVRTGFSQTVVPLTFLGRSEDYYFTYPGDADLPVAVVSIPQSRIRSVWNWLAIPHEVGHHVLAHFSGYIDELLRHLVRVLRTEKFTIEMGELPLPLKPAGIMAGIWHSWLEEIVADIYGVLFTGPAQVMSRQEDACRIGGGLSDPASAIWDATQHGSARHPACYVRCLFLTRLLRQMGFAPEAAALDARWEAYVGHHAHIDWYDDNHADPAMRTHLFRVAVPELLRAYDRVLEVVIGTPMKCLGGNRLAEIVAYDAEDHLRVLRIAEGLRTGIGEYERKDKARHILAASRYAFEAEPGAAEEIHATAVAAIQHAAQWMKWQQ